MTSLSDSIKDLLRIEDPNLIILDTDKKDGVFTCYAKLLLNKCPWCRSKNIIHNGNYLSHIKHLSVDASMPVIIRLRKQRIYCRLCHKRSMAQSTFINKHCHISNPVKQRVLVSLTEDRCMTSIAQENNISANTVSRVMAQFNTPFHFGLARLPEHLAFDEFRGVGRQLHFICIDGESHRIIKILPDRYKKSIIKYFMKFTSKARESVKTVSMDLNSYYQDIVHQIFPNAQVIIDRFHMVQMLNRSLNQLRIQTMKKFDQSAKEYKLLKSPWKLYLKRHQELEHAKPHYNGHLKDSLTQEQIVEDGLSIDAVFNNTYNLVQNFFEALDEKNVPQMRAAINSTDEVGDQMKTTLKTFKKNMTAVLNSLKYLYSNGCLEGTNRKIKQIQRTAFGYRNFKNMLARIKLEQKNTVLTEKRPCLAA